MTFRVLDALPVLVSRLGETINKVPSGDRSGLENVKVMAFKTSAGKLLALDVYPANMKQVKLWIEPPLSASIPGVVSIVPKLCADLDRKDLAPLSAGKALYLEISNRAALDDLLDWYA
ncbi:MAG: hypothetical protein ACK4PN_16650 [Allorhizobium sp.]